MVKLNSTWYIWYTGEWFTLRVHYLLHEINVVEWAQQDLSCAYKAALTRRETECTSSICKSKQSMARSLIVVREARSVGSSPHEVCVRQFSQIQKSEVKSWGISSGCRVDAATRCYLHNQARKDLSNMSLYSVVASAKKNHILRAEC